MPGGIATDTAAYHDGSNVVAVPRPLTSRRASIVWGSAFRAALIALLALAACEGPTSDGPGRAGELVERDTLQQEGSGAAELSATSCEGLENGLLATPPLRAALAAAFGPPDSATVVTRPNLHDPGVTDTVFAVHHPGLRLSGVQPTGGREVPGHLVVVDNRYLAAPRLGIGAEESAIVEAYGAPGARHPGALVYACGEVEQPVTFWLENGRVSRITVEFHVD
jgi:hypothetical protein